MYSLQELLQNQLAPHRKTLQLHLRCFDATASAPKNLSVNYVGLGRHFPEHDDGGGEMTERDEAALEFFVAHKQPAKAVEPIPLHTSLPPRSSGQRDRRKCLISKDTSLPLYGPLPGGDPVVG